MRTVASTFSQLRERATPSNTLHLFHTVSSHAARTSTSRSHIRRGLSLTRGDRKAGYGNNGARGAASTLVRPAVTSTFADPMSTPTYPPSWISPPTRPSAPWEPHRPSLTPPLNDPHQLAG